MSVFIDTGVFYAQHDRDAPRHEPAADTMGSLASGGYGRLYTSDYVYDETVTLTRTRTGRFDGAKAVGDRIRGVDPYPNVVTIVRVTERSFERSVEAFERYSDHSLSFTDASTVVLVEHHDIDHVVSFDTDFDGIVDRMDPVDVGSA
jgi:hypothetical protein